MTERKKINMSACDVFCLGFEQGQKSVMHIIDGIMFASTSDSETVKQIEKYAHEFWGDDAEYEHEFWGDDAE